MTKKKPLAEITARANANYKKNLYDVAKKSLAEITARANANYKKNLYDVAIKVLEMQRYEFEKLGDKMAILSAIDVCAVNNIPLPTWLANAFAKKFCDVKAFKYSSWEEAFDPPHPKKGKRGAGPKVKARQAHKELEIPVWLKIRELRGRGVKTTDNEIFKQAAKELKAAAGVKKTSYLTPAAVKRVYYANERDYEWLISIIALFRRLGGEVEAKALVEAHFEQHPYREVAIALFLNSQKFEK